MSIQDLDPASAGINWRLSPARQIRTPRETMEAKAEIETLQSITRDVARREGMAVADVLGERRFTPLVWARYEIWARAYELRSAIGLRRYSYPMIAEYFERDSSTVVTGVQKYRRAQAKAESGT